MGPLGHALDGKADKVREMVYELSEAMYGIKREQEYMDVRERTHSASESLPNYIVIDCALEIGT